MMLFCILLPIVCDTCMIEVDVLHVGHISLTRGTIAVQYNVLLGLTGGFLYVSVTLMVLTNLGPLPLFFSFSVINVLSC